MTAGAVAYSVVVPTTGRDRLRETLAALTGSPEQLPEEIVLVDDRPGSPPSLITPPAATAVRVVRSGGRGPAAARNTGWQRTTTEWVVFLDDDVVPDPGWCAALHQDLCEAPEDLGACQGRISVPLPTDRRPTDLERNTAGLATAWWITADMAYQRQALMRCGGFDERFPRAFREDADLALRVRELGYRIGTGSRTTTHPVRPAGFLASVRAQTGNADNALMRRKYGRDWRRTIGEGPGRTREHLLTTGAAVLAAGFTAAAPKSPLCSTVAKTSGLGWLALTLDFAARRILPGPRNPAEIARMLVTSALIPPVACRHRASGEIRAVRQPSSISAPPVLAVLFDRDDTLIHDVAYNADPARVRPLEGVGAALEKLRCSGIAVGVVSNQSGVARGLIDPEQLAAVNAEVERLLGPFATWQVCVHGESDGCGCRKPAPGLVKQAAEELGVPPNSCVVIGDTGADVTAANAAGARAVLVPTAHTRTAEIDRARQDDAVARTVPEAVQRLLREVWA